MALTNFAVFGGAFMTPVVVGKMASTIGWQWSFWFVSIFASAFLPILIFFIPETAFRRSEHFNTDTSVTLHGFRHSVVIQPEVGPGLHGPATELANRNSASTTRGEFEKTEPSSPSAPAAPQLASAPIATQPKPPYWHKLLPFNGRKTDESYWKLLLRPLPLFGHPGILWACLIQGTLIGWTVFLGIILAAIMLGPPLFFNEVKTGYMYTGAFVGAVVGFILSGLLSDSTANWMTRKNRGVYEPEFRLVLVIPQLILGCAGLYGFGITSANTYRYGWFWPDFFFALEVAGMVVGAVASALYIVDAHRKYFAIPRTKTQLTKVFAQVKSPLKPSHV
jgi:MFS family permease